MENRFTNFNKAKEEATIKNTLKVNSDHPSEVEKNRPTLLLYCHQKERC